MGLLCSRTSSSKNNGRTSEEPTKMYKLSSKLQESTLDQLETFDEYMANTSMKKTVSTVCIREESREELDKLEVYHNLDPDPETKKKENSEEQYQDILVPTGDPERPPMYRSPTNISTVSTERIDFRSSKSTISITHVDEWILEEEIGKGTQGTVYRARRAKNENLKVAIKKSRNIERQERELEILKSVKHPYICELISVIPADANKCYLVLALCKYPIMVQSPAFLLKVPITRVFVCFFPRKKQAIFNAIRP